MVKTFKIPWAAWREPEFLEISFPDSWDVSLCKMNGGPEIDDNKIKESILNPISTSKLSELAKGKEKIVIVVDDMTRTTPISRIIPHVLEELDKASIYVDQITILLALGAHKPMNRQDCILKLGEDVVNTINIENHHPYENLTNLGESKIGTPIEVNSTYVDSDLKISIGGVIPHPLAGFGGGAKNVLPGVCGIRTLEANHSTGFKGTSGGIGKVTLIREDIENTAEIVGLDFSINVILNEIGEMEGIEVICPGGVLDKVTMNFLGRNTEELLKNLNTDKAFISTSSISLKAGLTEPNPQQSFIKKMMLENALQKILLIDSSKFDVISLNRICPLNDLDIVITDNKPDNKYYRYFKQNNIKILF